MTQILDYRFTCAGETPMQKTRHSVIPSFGVLATATLAMGSGPSCDLTSRVIRDHDVALVTEFAVWFALVRNSSQVGLVTDR